LIDIGKGKKHRWVLDPQGLCRCLWDVRRIAEGQGLFFVLEKAQTMAPGGGGRSPASPRSMFQYGRGYGCLEMGLIALGIAYEAVHPRTWGGKVLKGMEGTNTKARAILKCQRAVPTLDLTPGRKRKPHDGLADAGCMALYAMTLRPVPGVRLPASRSPVPVELPPGPPRRGGSNGEA
jgi:crossover junction endodeoxyribonuclease RuvC